MKTKLLNLSHLDYCKSMAMGSTIDSAPHYVIASLATVSATLSRYLEPQMQTAELKRLISVMIGFASLSDIAVESRGKVITAMKHFVYVGEPWRVVD